MLCVHRYRLTRKLGGGSFGEVYEGEHLDTGQAVAIKLEHRQAQYPQLAWEYRLYQSLTVPEIFWYGEAGEYRALVMEKLGPNIEERRVGLPELAVKMVRAVQALHQAGYVHRDVKPENFLWGLGPHSSQLFLIDLGLAKAYRTTSGQHLPYRDGYSLIGTARYASLANHRGAELSRRDDLESVGYVLAFLHEGSLPWRNLGSYSSDAAWFRAVLDCKLQTPLEQITRQPALQRFLTYCRQLRFAEDPHYDYLVQLFKQ